MPDLDTLEDAVRATNLIAEAWKPNERQRIEQAAVLLVAEVERLRAVEAELSAALHEVVRLSSAKPPPDVVPDAWSRLGLVGMTAFTALSTVDLEGTP